MFYCLVYGYIINYAQQLLRGISMLWETNTKQRNVLETLIIKRLNKYNLLLKVNFNMCLYLTKF